MSIDRTLSGHEFIMRPTQTIQSRTDLRGVITFANRTFTEVSGYTREELVGAPHSILRHPDMPRTAFYVMWQTIQAGQEFYGYVNNRAKNGDNYWVITYVAPHFSPEKVLDGYSSVRRSPLRDRIPEWQEIYRKLNQVEAKYPRKDQCEAGKDWLINYLQKHTRFDDLTQYVLSGL
ncbi:MAG: PAS domain-containing protein [Halothiobacillus sp.]